MLSLLTLLAGVVQAPFPPPADRIDYVVRLVPAGSRTDLVVDVRYRPDSTDGETVTLPRDGAYGFPVARYVAALEGLDGTAVADGPDAVTRRVTPARDGTAHLRYRLAFTFEDRGDATYAPSTGPRHVHAAAAQWMLGVGAASRSRAYVVRVEAPDASWSTYNTLGAAPVIATRQGIGRAMLGGVQGAPHRFTAAGGAVRVFTPGGFTIPTRELGGMVERLIRAQRRAFGSGGARFDVVVLPRPDNVAGVATANGFVAFVRPTVARDQLARLLAHETLHAWMSDALVPADSGGSETDDFLRSRWFIEGVTDFAARVLLRQGGVLGERDFAALVNRDLMDLADNPRRAVTFETMRRDADSGRYDIAYTKLQYYRGALIALGWSAPLRAGGRTLPSLLAALYRAARARSAPMSWDEFLAYFARAGLDVRGDEARVVWRGEWPALDPGALGPRWTLRDSLVPAFDPGFDVAASRAAKTLVGVVPGGPAARAGARDGMALVALSNENRFSYAWRRDAPLVVEVLDDGTTRRLEIAPWGAARPLRLYVPRPAAAR